MNAETKQLEEQIEQHQPRIEAQKPNLLDEVVQKTQGILISEHGLDYADIAGLWRIAKMIYVSKLYPKGLDSPEAICIAIAKGRSVGLMDPFQAVESIAVINGKAALYGDAPLAICRQNPHWDEAGFEEYFEVAGKRIEGSPQTWTDDTIAVCVTRRKRGKPRVEKFSVADAKRAKLWGKEGPWTFYPVRLMRFRARGFNLRDNFGDSLKGLQIRELYEGDEMGNGDQPKQAIDLNERIKEASKSAPKKTPQEITESQKPRNAQVAEPIREVINEISPQVAPESKEEPPAPFEPATPAELKKKILELIPQLLLKEERKAYMNLLGHAKTGEEIERLYLQISEALPKKAEEAPF